MRPVIHDPADGDDAGARRRGEGRDDRLRLRNGFGRGREHLIDDRHLRGMDCHLADETVAASLLAFAAQTFAVSKIDKDRVDRRHCGSGGAGEAQGARQAIGIEEPAFAVTVRARAKLGG